MQNKYYIDYVDIINAITNPQDMKNVENVVSQLDEFLRFKQDGQDIKLFVRVKKEEVVDLGFTKKLPSFFPGLSAVGIEPQDIALVIENSAQSYVYENNEWETVKALASYIEKNGATFGIEDISKTFSIQEVENANKKIGKTAADIKSKDLSPVEKLMAAYREVTSRPYVEEASAEETAVSRSLYDVLNSNRIVCVGYAYWLKAIMDTIGDENIKIYPNTVACSEDNVKLDGYHANLIIYIKDEKYGIDGYYYVDPTWDATRTEGKYSGLYNYFLVPLSDIPNISPYHIRQKGTLGDFSGNIRELLENRPKHDIWGNSAKYNTREATQKVSFTGDGFVPSREFLRDFFRIKPNETKDLIDEVKRAKITKCLMESEIAQSKIKIVREIKNILKEHGVECIKSYENYSLCRAIMDCVDALDIEPAQKIIQELIAKYEDGKEYNRSLDSFKEELIEHMFSRDHSIRFMLGIDVKNPEENNLIKALSKKIDDYFEDHKKYIYSVDRLSGDQDVLQRIYDFAKDCKTEESLDKLIEYIGDEIHETPGKETFIADDESVTAALKENRQIIERNNNIIANIDKVKSDDEMIDEIISSEAAGDKIEELLLGMSDPLELKKMAEALKAIIKAKYVDSSEEKIDAYINRIVAQNVKEASDNFFGEARNAFAVTAAASKQNTESESRGMNE